MSQWARPAPLLDSIYAAWVGGPLHGEIHMATVPKIDWNAVIADPRFQVLHRKKQGFLTGLMIFSVVFYFMLPIGAAYFQDLFKTRIWGVVNFGLLFALTQFVVAWLVAFYYSRRAGAEFDRLAHEIAADYEKKGRA
jgi:uncharacterized membrane protein (DUF485 family)